MARSSSVLKACTALLLPFAQSVAQQPAAPVASFDSLSRQAAAARDAGKLDDAVALYGRALKLRPSWDEGWWNLGSIEYDRDKFTECAAAFDRLTALKADLSPAWIMSGLCQYGKRDYRAALHSFLRSELLHFDGPPELSRAARLHLALCLTKAGTFEKAIVTLTELTRMDRRTPEIAIAAGIAGLRKAWLPPEVPEVDREMVSRLGDAMASGMELDPKAALEKFAALVNDLPNQPDIRFRYGAFLMQQEPEKGIEQLKKAIELDPGHIPALVGLSTIYLRNGETQAALTYGERAVLADPGDFATHVALGRALLETDDSERAADQFRIATKLAPESADAHFSLASAYSRLGRKEDAQREQEEFKRLRKIVDAAHP